MATFWSKNAFKVKARVRVLQITPAVGSILFLEESEGVTFTKKHNLEKTKPLTQRSERKIEIVQTSRD